ncbi:MAG: OsmC family protein [Deltaproteobacteria bacterium]|nr:OsmC family protein [Deltaproteobacteria bacterium]
MESKVVWKEGMSFDVHLDGHVFTIDADEAVGGKNQGPKPKGLTLSSLAGCTGMDVISILTKMRIPVQTLEVTARAELTEEHPKRFKKIITRYEVTGPDDISVERIQRAVVLSEERYCGVSATLKPSVEMLSEIVVNGVQVEA